MGEPVMLDPRLDLPAASPLMTTLRAQDAHEVTLDFTQVKHLGALCLQVILSAALTFSAEGRKLSITNVSDRVIDQMRVMGMTPEKIARGRQ
jgi:chemotaxis protein CheX